jgi:tRNA A-37 threonylcarbamoyl transferase component Bud32
MKRNFESYYNKITTDNKDNYPTIFSEADKQTLEVYHQNTDTTINLNDFKCEIGCKEGALSNFGEIVGVCLKCNNEVNDKYIGKIIPYDVTPGGRTGVKREITIQTTASREGLAPNIKICFLDESKSSSEDSKKALIIMDKINGNTIQSKLETIMDTAIAKSQESQNDPITEINKLFDSVIIGLTKLHSIGIYHGDAHLENFMYDQQDKIWIIDFGHSSYFDPQESHVKILEDYVSLRSAVSSLSKSKIKKVLKGYSVYLNQIITQLDLEIQRLEEGIKKACAKPSEEASADAERSAEAELSFKKLSTRSPQKKKHMRSSQKKPMRSSQKKPMRSSQKKPMRSSQKKPMRSSQKNSKKNSKKKASMRRSQKRSR